MNFKAIIDLVKATFKDWSEDKAARLGASLAYYTIFSLGPLLLIVVAIAGLVFGEKAARGQIVNTLGGLLGSTGSQQVEEMIKSASKPSTSIIATIIGIVTLLLGASGVFGQLKDALNTIWEVAPKPGGGILNMLRQRFLTFTMVLGTGFLLMVSLVVTAAVSAFNKVLTSILPGGDIVGQVVSVIVTLSVLALMFALLYKFLPDVKIAWSDVWIGAVVTAILFTVGQVALGIYLGSGSVGSAYGAAGSLVIILVWIYYSAQIFFLGAEFTQVYTNKYGSRVTPAANAEFVTDDAKAQQGIVSQGDGAGAKRDRHQQAGQAEQEGKKRAWRPGLASPWFK